MTTISKITPLITLLAILCACRSPGEKHSDYFTPSTQTSETAAPTKPAKPPPFTQMDAEADICEQVVRRFSQEAAANLKPVPERVFVSFATAQIDPNADFLDRFSAKKPRIAPMSERPRGEVPALEKGRNLYLNVARVDWVDYYNVEVPCSWSDGVGRPSVITYKLRWKRGKWRVL